jgi:DNA polymerase sigma
MAYLTSEFVRLCCAYDPRIKTLCMILKYWAYHYKLAGTFEGSSAGRDTVMSNYTLTILIIFFLQKDELLPSVKEMQVRQRPILIFAPRGKPCC